MYYVQIFGAHTNKIIADLLGDEADDSVTEARVVALKREIDVYRLRPEEMRQLWASKGESNLNFEVYHMTSLGLVHVANVTDSLAQHEYTHRETKSQSGVVDKTKKQLEKKLEKFRRVQASLV